jgi:hypothetical protein
MSVYVRDDVGKTAQQTQKYRCNGLNQRPLALQAAAFTTRILGLKSLGVALAFYTWRFRTTFVHALELEPAALDLSRGD